jgi:hypothetical protein
LSAEAVEFHTRHPWGTWQVDEDFVKAEQTIAEYGKEAA